MKKTHVAVHDHPASDAFCGRPASKCANLAYSIAPLSQRRPQLKNVCKRCARAAQREGRS